MEPIDRMYWFLRNLSAFALGIIVYPIFVTWTILRHIPMIFITDGSEVLSYPWDWDWVDEDSTQ